MMAGSQPGAGFVPAGSTVQATTLVVGPGWLGSALAVASADRGDAVFTLSRGGPEGTAWPQGVDGRLGDSRLTALRGDITAAATPGGLRSLLAAAPAAVDHVVLCVAPSRARGDRHATLYPGAARGAVRLAEALAARTLVYTSSTGVYGATDGALVQEDDVIAPRDERQAALLDAEREILAGRTGGRIGSIVLRVAGLYGPGRDPAPRLRSAHGNPASAQWSNFAWRDDVVRAVLHLQAHSHEPTGHRLFNCADGHPVLAADVSRALQGGGDADDAPLAAPAADRTLPAAPATQRSNQRVSVERLLATRWAPAVPTVFDGLVLLGHTVRQS